MSEIEDRVKEIIKKEQDVEVKIIKEDVYNYIKEHNGDCDMVDVACNFKEFTCDIPSLAIHELIEDGRVEYKEARWSIQPYRLFVKE